MEEVGVIFADKQATVYSKHLCIGSIDLWENPYHNQHTYLQFNLTSYDERLAIPLFQAIQQHVKRPLQVMLSSADHRPIAFLKAGGFQCKRKCYEMAVSMQDYLGIHEQARFQIVEQPHATYHHCCQRILDYYQETHRAISPFTGSEEDFFERLPSTVYCHSLPDDIQSLAFINNHEIAYLWSKKQEHLPFFLQQIIPHLFKQYDTITFEADDVDPCAMMLKSLFTSRTDEHWDTYILS